MTRTLKDYRPQHDEGCASRRCSKCNQAIDWLDGSCGCSDYPRSAPKPCTCGLDALLTAPAPAGEATPAMPPDSFPGTDIDAAEKRAEQAEARVTHLRTEKVNLALRLSAALGVTSDEDGGEFVSIIQSRMALVTQQAAQIEELKTTILRTAEAGLKSMQRALELDAERSEQAQAIQTFRAALEATLDYWTATGFAACEPDCNCVVESVRAALKDTPS